MKRLYPLLISFIFIFSLLFALPARRVSSQGEIMVRIEPDVVALSPGETTTIEIWVENINDLWGFSLEISFDPELLEVWNLRAGGFLETTPGKYIEAVKRIDEDGGLIQFDISQLRVTDDDPEPRDGDGVLIEFDVVAKENKGVCNLEIIEVNLSDRNGVSINTNVNHGYVHIVGTGGDFYIYLPLIIRP